MSDQIFKIFQFFFLVGHRLSLWSNVCISQLYLICPTCNSSSICPIVHVCMESYRYYTALFWCVSGDVIDHTVKYVFIIILKIAQNTKYAFYDCLNETRCIHDLILLIFLVSPPASVCLLWRHPHAPRSRVHNLEATSFSAQAGSLSLDLLKPNDLK